MTIGSDVETIKNCYGVLNTIFHELENKFISLERNMEKPMRKYDTIKTRIRTLEKDVMKNTSHVIGMDHSNRSMESWTRLQYFGSAGMFPHVDNRCYGEPPAFDSASSYYDIPPVSRPQAQYFLPPMTQFGPSAPPPAPQAPNAFSRPPAPPEPSAFLSKPPPITPKKPGLKVTGSDESSSSSVIIPKVEKVYNKIPITTAMLKSVVLKPPNEKKREANRWRYNHGVFII
ncbi:formin-B-like [Acyrthosiphon pisum]|uniref:Uncharacterized protein n=1 Tax=Acyrthosiphon pisum TaxID=7029 RepID=A0A8R2NMX6_ACYPI|nr:formin-B-like [Acyrthosiphon pisum]